jgi:integrase
MVRREQRSSPASFEGADTYRAWADQLFTRLRRSNFRPIWNAARTKAGAPELHFHDLRHVGGTLAAATGASVKELMARLGHSSTRAALIYQHATRDRDQSIAEALGGLVQQVRTTRGDDLNAGRQDA